MSKGPYMENVDALIAMGINPTTGLPYKVEGSGKSGLKSQIKKTLRILDEQQAVNRYKWFNLPSGLTGQLLERILYYKGDAMLFYMDSNDTFFFLPYCLDGSIDVYGQYTAVTPIPFRGQADGSGKDKPWITGLNRVPVYDMGQEITEDTFFNGCVLLHDYSLQMSQNSIPRQLLNDPIIDAEAEAFPLARTSLISNSGVKGMRVQDDGSGDQVKLASRSVTNAALSGDPWIPITSTAEFQDLTANNPSQSEEFLAYMQSLDNYRLSLYGLNTDSVFQKKAHMLQSEDNARNANDDLPYQDGLKLRQDFCNLVNKIWHLGIWCDTTKEDQDNDANKPKPREETGTKEYTPVNKEEGGSENDEQ